MYIFTPLAPQLQCHSNLALGYLGYPRERRLTVVIRLPCALPYHLIFKVKYSNQTEDRNFVILYVKVIL